MAASNLQPVNAHRLPGAAIIQSLIHIIAAPAPMMLRNKSPSRLASFFFKRPDHCNGNRSKQRFERDLSAFGPRLLAAPNDSC